MPAGADSQKMHGRAVFHTARPRRAPNAGISVTNAFNNQLLRASTHPLDQPREPCCEAKVWAIEKPASSIE